MSRSIAGRRRSSGSAGTLLNIVLAVGFVAAIGLAAFAGKYPREVFYLIAALSLLALVLYGKDKLAAIRNRWRVSESTLHTVAVFGGWPGALLAQHLFNHKTSKRPFRVIFWLTVLINCSAIAWTFTGSGADFLYKSLAAVRGYYSLATG